MENLAYGKKCNQNAPFSGKNLKNFLGRGHIFLGIARIKVVMEKALIWSGKVMEKSWKLISAK